MIRAFLDTNVLIDWIVETDRPYREASLQIAQAILDHKLEGFVSTQSLVDTAYVASRAGCPFSCFEQLFRKMLQHINLTSLSSFDMLHALDHPSGDFEDDAQLSCADHEFCRYFVTGDSSLLRCKSFSDMEILSPPAFIQQLQ